MAVQTGLQVTKFPTYSLTEQDYESKLNSKIQFSNKSILGKDLLEELYNKGVVKVSNQLSLGQTEVCHFSNDNASLISDYRKKRDLNEVKQILEMFDVTRNINKICGRFKCSKHYLFSLIFKHVKLEDALHFIDAQEVSSFLSKETYNNTVRVLSIRFNESMEEITKHLSISALERLEGQTALEKTVAIFVGLADINMNFIEIAKELNLNPRFVSRMLIKYKRGMYTVPESLTLFNQIKGMLDNEMSIEQIANHLGLKPLTVSIVLGSKK